MSELERQAYMSAMGEPCYVPRLCFPGAKASVQCELPVVDSHGGLLSVQTGVIDAPHKGGQIQAQSLQPLVQRQSGTSAAASLFEELTSGTDKRARGQSKVAGTAAPLNKPLASRKGKSSVPHFALSVARTENLIIVDDGVPEGVQPAEYSRLLQNIVFAMVGVQQELSLEPFVWPMIKNNRVDQSEPAARQTLEAYLAKQTRQLGVAYIIAMGDTAAHYLCTREKASDGFVDHDLLPVRLICAPSAVRSLSEPGLKPQIWHKLQPLRSALATPRQNR